MSSTANGMYIMDTVNTKDMIPFNEMVYKHLFKQFCNDVSEIKCLSRSERAMGIVPAITPENLTPEPNKCQKNDEGLKPNTGCKKANTSHGYLDVFTLIVAIDAFSQYSYS